MLTSRLYRDAKLSPEFERDLGCYCGQVIKLRKHTSCSEEKDSDRQFNSKSPMHLAWLWSATDLISVSLRFS